MKPFILLLIAGVLVAGEPVAPVERSSPALAADAMAMLGKLPDPLVAKQLEDFFDQASSEDAGRVLMHIAISAIRPARPLVAPMLSHRDPVVVERALRALSAIGVGSTALREQIEQQLRDGSPTVAIQAATCLGSGDDVRAVPALISRMTKGPPEVAGSALAALKKLSQVDFQNDATAWEAWYQTHRVEAQERLTAQVERLASADTKVQISAIQTLASMRGERQEAQDLIEPMVRAQDPVVAMAARQALATLAPTEYTMPTTAEAVAATKPAPAAAPAPAPSGVMSYLANQGLFDTWYGLLLTTFTGILLLSVVLFLLRTGPVKNATRRFGRVVVAGTMRFVRPATSRLQLGTKRIIRQFSQSKSDTPDAGKKPG